MHGSGFEMKARYKMMHCSSATYLLETAALCTCSVILEVPMSKSGMLVGPENEYMAGRHLSSLLEGAE